MKIFLLDDEESARETIKSFLYKSDIQSLVIKEADSVESALEVLRSYQPDLSILDINLGAATSFDLLSRLDEIKFKIIFVSAYDAYAIKAFKFNALDYILKPINPIEFNAAIDKVMTSESHTSREQLDQLNKSLDSKEIDKLILRDSQTIHFLDIVDIIQCKSESNYTVFCTMDGSEITISKTLGEYEPILKEKNFFRSHRSHLINLYQIKKFDKREGGFITMNNGEIVPLARNRKEVFMKLISRM